MSRPYSVRIFLLCDNALFTQECKIDNALALPIPNRRYEETAEWAWNVCQHLGIAMIDLPSLLEVLKDQSNRIPPTFGLYYDDVDTDFDVPGLVRFCQNELKITLGAIALSRGAYPRPRIMIAYKRWEGKCQPSITLYDSYYRGNIAGGIISGESNEMLTRIARASLRSTFLREVLDKFRLALIEEDLDIAYLRFWSLLETIVAHQCGDNNYTTIKLHIKKCVEETNHNPLKSFRLGVQEFNQEQIISIWYEARNLTAHHGGYHLAQIKGKKIHGDLDRLIRATEADKRMYVMGEDYVFILLRDCVEMLIKREIKTTEPNQSPETTTMAVTPAASHPSRQP